VAQCALRENQGHGYYTWRFEGKIEAGDDPSCHIYCEGDPWAADWQSIPFIENDQVHWTVIYLKKLEGKCRLNICVNWSERLPGCLSPEPGFRKLLRIVLGKPLSDRPIIRSLHFDSSAFLSDAVRQCSE
jgi:hypothetical protein